MICRLASRCPSCWSSSRSSAIARHSSGSRSGSPQPNVRNTVRQNRHDEFRVGGRFRLVRLNAWHGPEDGTYYSKYDKSGAGSLTRCHVEEALLHGQINGRFRWTISLKFPPPDNTSHHIQFQTYQCPSECALVLRLLVRCGAGNYAGNVGIGFVWMNDPSPWQLFVNSQPIWLQEAGKTRGLALP